MIENKKSSFNELVSTDVKVENISLKKRALKKLGQVGLGLLSAALIVGSKGASVGAVDAAKEVVGSEAGREALNQALKFARSKPAISIAASIACMPVAGVAASPSMCVASGILIAKTLG